MLFKLLDSIRKKPSHVRSLIALSTSLALTLIVIVIWFFSYSTYIKEVMFESKNKDVIGASEEVEPLDALKNSVTEGWDSMKDQVSNVPFVDVTGGPIDPDASSPEQEESGESAPGNETEFEAGAEADMEVRPNNSSTSTGSQAENLIE